jgi:hypothetical protein
LLPDETQQSIHASIVSANHPARAGKTATWYKRGPSTRTESSDDR